MALAQLDRAGVARGECLVFAAAPVVPNRTDGMNHMPGRQPVSHSDFRLAGRAATERAAFVEQLGPRGPMDRTIDATATEQ